MLHDYAIDHFLLYSILGAFFEVTSPISGRSSLPPGFHCGGVLIIAPALYAHSLQHWTFGSREQSHVIIRHVEVKDTQTIEGLLIFRGLHDTMNGGLIVTSREKSIVSPVLMTKALSICLTHRHLPSGDKICKPPTGWLHRIVMLPTSVCPLSQTFFDFASSSSERVKYFMNLTAVSPVASKLCFLTQVSSGNSRLNANN